MTSFCRASRAARWWKPNRAVTRPPNESRLASLGFAWAVVDHLSPLSRAPTEGTRRLGQSNRGMDGIAVSREPHPRPRIPPTYGGPVMAIDPNNPFNFPYPPGQNF